jgi:DNA-directed RNA polymerase subunit alpha
MSSFHFECTELNLQLTTDYYGRFVFNALETGQGITIGNILRRVLLNSLTGLAITKVRIANINNEFATIPGVREDILEILLNLKEVIFKHNEEESKYLLHQKPIGRLKVFGPAIITASSFQLPSDTSIINPTQYIATISDSSILEMEILLDFGKGYTLAENKPIINKDFNKLINNEPSDLISVDAIFMPVKRVAFNIETSFSELTGVQEKLIFEIWTNGSITPSDAISLATKTIIDWFSQINTSNLQFVPKLDTIDKKTSIIENYDINTIKIEELNLSSRAYKSLKKANIYTVGELTNYTLINLKKLKNFGKKSLAEVTKVLEENYKITLH